MPHVDRLSIPALVDAVGSAAPGFIFTTALPPVIAAGALASLAYLRRTPELRQRHQASVARLKHLLTEAGLPLMLLRMVLVHELGHVSLGCEHLRLPQWAEEGSCDWLAHLR